MAYGEKSDRCVIFFFFLLSQMLTWMWKSKLQYPVCEWKRRNLDVYLFLISWLLGTMLLWTWECRCPSKIVILFPCNIYTEVKLLDHMAVLFLTSWWPSTLLSTFQIYMSHSPTVANFWTISWPIRSSKYHQPKLTSQIPHRETKIPYATQSGQIKR